MQIPKRRAQLLRGNDDKDDVLFMTAEGIEHLKRQLKDLEGQLPQAVEAMSFALSLGDFSENAEYQDAKHKLARLHSRIFSIKDRLRRVRPITKSSSGTIQLGSTVTLSTNSKEKMYQLVTPHEANPSRGKISTQSPLGAALIGKRINEEVSIQTETGSTVYTVVNIT